MLLNPALGKVDKTLENKGKEMEVNQMRVKFTGFTRDPNTFSDSLWV